MVLWTMHPRAVGPWYTVIVKRSEFLFGLLRIPLDALAVVAALLVAYRLREASVDLIPNVQLLEPPRSLPDLRYYMQTFVLQGTGLFIALAAILRLYALRITTSAWNEMARILLTSLLWFVAVVGWFFLVRKQLFYSRVLLVHGVFFTTLFVVLARTAVVLLQRAALRNGIGVRHVISLGSKPVAPTALDTLQTQLHYRYEGHFADLASVRKKRKRIDLIVQTDPSPGSRQTQEILNHCRAHQIEYAFLPPVLADVPQQIRVGRLGLVPVMYLQPTPLDGWGRIAKRLFDIVISTLLIILLSPLFVFLCILCILCQGFPIFYTSKRVGEKAKCTTPVLKFRSMVRNADELKEELAKKNERKDGPLFKMRSDPRITKCGRFMRRFDLDELPQLLNVFLGHLSLVGPRPHLQSEVDRYQEHQRRVFTVKPGITGLAQISGRSNLPFDEEVRLDLQYIEEWSIFLDLWILWRTVFVVLRKEGR